MPKHFRFSGSKDDKAEDVLDIEENHYRKELKEQLLKMKKKEVGNLSKKTRRKHGGNRDNPGTARCHQGVIAATVDDSDPLR
jgi:hypothetical protein